MEKITFIAGKNLRTVVWRNSSALPELLIAGGEWCRVFGENAKRSPESVFVKKDFFF